MNLCPFGSTGFIMMATYTVLMRHFKTEFSLKNLLSLNRSTWLPALFEMRIVHPFLSNQEAVEKLGFTSNEKQLKLVRVFNYVLKMYDEYLEQCETIQKKHLF